MTFRHKVRPINLLERSNNTRGFKNSRQYEMPNKLFLTREEHDSFTVLIVNKKRNEHFSIMCMMRMFKTKDNMAFFSETLPERADNMRDIVSGLKEIHRIPFIDEYRHFFFYFIEYDISNMVFCEFLNIFFMYFLKK